MSQKHSSAILETISKVLAFVLFHQEVALLSRDSQLGAASLLTHQHHFGLSSLAYQGRPWARLHLSSPVACLGLTKDA